MARWLMTILFLIVSAFLTQWIPFSSFFRNINTMIHEFGHALTTLVLSGKVLYIELYSDHSGVTRSAVSQSWALILVALAGYISSSLFAWFMFSLDAKGKHKLGLTIVTAIAVLSLILFVRNGYGVLWLAGFIALSVIILLVGGLKVGRFYYLLIAFLMLEDSVFGSFSLILYALDDPASAGDAALLSQHTPLPAVVWAILFTLFSLWCAVRALMVFIRPRKVRKPAAASTESNI
ncbi:M50 family metallopeptidase [Paenibacillus sp. J2TS4]|uniref:M50 family metallopeptidase n=1 Tax=Paenibacillus sp. J2TS4 TaxID=2807194 RepID=UPI001B077C5E|nr:M50 family metallopeptidase [Paenibacillus sp. J2TS4]GIP34258.1 hypothetical protein J2TS4_34680 [Paenibacillus sp. J2TS4]